MKGSKKAKSISYAKWGYIFLIPFFLIYIIFFMIPVFQPSIITFENYEWTDSIGPNFVGLKTIRQFFGSDLPKYAYNTLLIWIVGFIPQIVISMVLAFGFNAFKIEIYRFFQNRYIYA